MIFGYTKLYSLKEKAEISFEITNKKIRLFSSMLLLSGCHKVPDCKMYWEATPDTLNIERKYRPRFMYLVFLKKRKHRPRFMYLVVDFNLFFKKENIDQEFLRC